MNDYRPGAGYFDVAALDVYMGSYTQSKYDAMLAGAGGKPIGIAECAKLPDSSLLASQPRWAYAVVWPDFFYPPYADYNTAQVPQLFNDPRVLTLSKMPGW